MNKKTLMNFILKIPHYLGIALRLHSESPNNEIKKNWEIFVLGGLSVVLLTVFSGVTIFNFIPTLKIDYINDYGGFIFFIFVVLFSIIFFDSKRCMEITKKLNEKQPKP